MCAASDWSRLIRLPILSSPVFVSRSSLSRSENTLGAGGRVRAISRILSRVTAIEGDFAMLAPPSESKGKRGRNLPHRHQTGAGLGPAASYLDLQEIFLKPPADVPEI